MNSWLKQERDFKQNQLFYILTVFKSCCSEHVTDFYVYCVIMFFLYNMWLDPWRTMYLCFMKSFKWSYKWNILYLIPVWLRIWPKDLILILIFPKVLPSELSLYLTYKLLYLYTSYLSYSCLYHKWNKTKNFLFIYSFIHSFFISSNIKLPKERKHDLQ